MSRFKIDGLNARVRAQILAGTGKPAKSKGKRIKAAVRYAAFPDFCERMGLPRPVQELRFHPVRFWRMDFAWPEYGVFLEVQGGLFTNGRHNRGAAMLKEFEKINTASSLGWRPLYCQPSDLMTTATADFIRAALNHKTT